MHKQTRRGWELPSPMMGVGENEREHATNPGRQMLHCFEHRPLGFALVDKPVAHKSTTHVWQRMCRKRKCQQLGQTSNSPSNHTKAQSRVTKKQQHQRASGGRKPPHCLHSLANSSSFAFFRSSLFSSRWRMMCADLSLRGTVLPQNHSAPPTHPKIQKKHRE